MSFTSMREYFYKISTVLYAFMLVPLVLFGYVYIAMRSGDLNPVLLDQRPIILPLFIFVSFVDWMVAILLFRRGLKEVRSMKMLSDKLGRYGRLTYLRFGMISSGSLLLGVGFLLTGDNIFAGVFAASLVLLSLLWPLPPKVCKDLRLKGDERKLVLHRLDSL